MALPKGLDPVETNGTSGDTSKRGVYVFEPKNEFDEKTGDKKFLEAVDPAQADAFIHQGWRLASESESKEYYKNVDESKEELRGSLSGEAREQEQINTDSKRAVSGRIAPKEETK